MTNLSVASPKRSVPKPAVIIDVAAEPERPPYLMAALVALGTLILYVLTLAPTTQFWDTSGYIAAAKVLGIPHPPGNPLFTLVAHTWGMIPWAANYGVRIKLFAAVTSAVAAGCWVLKDERNVGAEERRLEWTQWVVFTAVYGLIVATGLESWKPFALAVVLYASALLFAWWHANNWRFALLALGVAALGLSVIVFLPIRAAHY